MNQCYQCKYRQSIAGDTHSRCTVLQTKTGIKDGEVLAAAVMMQDSEISLPEHGLRVAGEEHGVREGWFVWPLNFDPVWLRECTGFEKANEVAA